MAAHNKNPGAELFEQLVVDSTLPGTEIYSGLVHAQEVHTSTVGTLKRQQDGLLAHLQEAHNYWDPRINRNELKAESQRSSLETIGKELATNVINGYSDGLVSPGTLLYVGGMLNYSDRNVPGVVLDFQRGARNFERFSSIIAGTQLLHWGGVEIESAESPYADVTLRHAGFATGEPTVSYRGYGAANTIERDSAVIVPLKDADFLEFRFGRELVAIGNDELGSVLDSWITERHKNLINDGQLQKQLISTFDGLTVLDPLELTSDAVSDLRNRAVDRLLELCGDRPGEAEMVVRKIGSSLTSHCVAEVVAQIISFGRLSMHREIDLIRIVATSMDPHFDGIQDPAVKFRLYTEASNKVSLAMH